MPAALNDLRLNEEQSKASVRVVAAPQRYFAPLCLAASVITSSTILLESIDLFSSFSLGTDEFVTFSFACFK